MRLYFLRKVMFQSLYLGTYYKNIKNISLKSFQQLIDNCHQLMND